MNIVIFSKKKPFDEFIAQQQYILWQHALHSIHVLLKFKIVTISILLLKVNAGGLEVIDTQNNLEITNLSEGTSSKF
jgi:hypothetical protein